MATIDLTPLLGSPLPAPLSTVALAADDQTRRLGACLVRQLIPGDLVALIGDLGAGKTTLVSGMVAALGQPSIASSPTYTLLNLYDTQPPMLHADLWRLERLEELETTGYWDYVDAGRWVMCVEWLNRVPDAWPGQGTVVALERDGAGRRATIWGFGSVAERLARALDTFHSESS
jgi:tRNA threonylcarbamoyl adenosine modification protein YjeE